MRFRQETCVRIPNELGLPPGSVGRLVRCCYGTRDAGMLWEESYAQVLTDAGFTRGQASPCCFYHPQREISIVCHGDDFVAMGTDEDLTWYEDILSQAFELGERKRLGHEPGDVQELRILNRIVRLHHDQLTYEADPRHIELLSRSLNLTQCRLVSTPGRKHKINEDEHADIDADTQLDLQGGDATHMQLPDNDPDPDLPQMCLNPLPRLRPPDYVLSLQLTDLK